MANGMSSVIELQLDASKAVANVTELGGVLESLKKASVNVGAAMSKALTSMLNSLNKVQVGLDNISATCSKLIETMGAVKNTGNAAEDTSSIFGSIAEGYKSITQAFDKMDEAEEYSVSFRNVFEEVMTTPNMGTLLKDLFPKSTELASTVSSWVNNDLLGTISYKLQQNGGKLGAAASNMISSITGAFQKVGGALSGLSVGWGAAIAGIVTLIVLLVQNWDSVKAAILAGWDAIMQGIGVAAEWIDTNVIQPVVGFFSAAIEGISTKLQEGFAFVQSIFDGISNFLQGVFATDWTEQFGAFGNVLNAFFANVENIWNAIKSIFSGIVDFVKNVFAGDWGAAWDSIVHVFKGIWEYLLAIVKAPINGIIGLINGLVQGVVDGINLVIKALNSVSFGIPDWVPVIGGQTFGFNLQMLNAPQIPYLAKGAVLPANKPFLAVVGDQKHGTNVEAPLTTIQEAVGLVMGDHIAAMMAEALHDDGRGFTIDN